MARMKPYDGTWIRVALARLDWSARDLEAVTGISRWSLYNYMRGRNHPTDKAIARIRAAFKGKK